MLLSGVLKILHKHKWRHKITIAILLIAIPVCCSSCGVLGYGARRVYKKEAVYHQVKPGENMYGIAQKYGVDVEQVALLNGIHDTKKITPGQRLLIRQAYKYEMQEDGTEKPIRPGSVSSSVKKPLYYSDGKFKWPVQNGGRLVSKFGPRNGSFHDGLDIAAESGTPVLAAHDGEVIYSGDMLSGYGNLLIIKGAGNLKTVYAHNRRLLVKESKRVKRGQIIAEVGSTGRSEAPHLHFEVRTKDKQGRFVAIDPLPFFHKNAGKPRYRVNDNLSPILAAADESNG